MPYTIKSPMTLSWMNLEKFLLLETGKCTFVELELLYTVLDILTGLTISLEGFMGLATGILC